MKLAISNLAWNNPFDENILSILKNKKINLIEGVLTKITKWENLSISKVTEYKKLLDQYGLKIESIQSIFFETNIVSLYETEKIIDHFKKLLTICNILNVKLLVLGSPNLRKELYSQDKLNNTFSEIDNLLISYNVMLTIEPNSKVYGGQYFNSIDEIIYFLKKNKFKKIKTMIDTHNLLLENEKPNYILKKYFNYINHIHISEKNLKKLEDLNFHKQFSNTIKKLKYQEIITYEVNELLDFENELEEFIKIYS
jgi:sugar phosphate isomerase/epimerase